MTTQFFCTNEVISLDSSLFYSPKYFNFMLLQGGVIREILAHLKFWKVLKSNNTMYQKDLFKDSSSSHL